jgi:DNA-binding MarR family transcriptional regulator
LFRQQHQRPRYFAVPVEFETFPLDRSPGYMIYRTATKLKAALTRAFQSHGFDITPEQWAVLNRLWEKEGAHQSALAESVSKDRHNVARILHLMEKSGLVTRAPDGHDKRYQRVFLTDKGRTLKDVLVGIVERHLHGAFQGLTEQEVRELIRLHERINSNLQARIPAPPQSK